MYFFCNCPPGVYNRASPSCGLWCAQPNYPSELRALTMTELIWDGKYKDGKKQGPVRIALPFQTIETVNESSQDRQRNLELFASGRDMEWRNRLIWGDKKYVLPSLLPEFAGKINLIYIDPPFDTGADFSYDAFIPDNPDKPTGESVTFTKEPSILEQKAYRDTWGRGLDSYLQWFFETTVVLRELLADDGTFYVHLDWHVGHYAKVILDEVFGSEDFRNEIAWCYSQGGRPIKGFPNKHDTIFMYSKGPAYNFYDDQIKVPYELISAKSSLSFTKIDENGRRYKEVYGTDRKKLYRYYMDEGKKPFDWWTDIPKVTGRAAASDFTELAGFPTQKPEKLLERIINASSKKGDLVLDCFAGSGTTAVAAEKGGRRWIACDLGRFAIHSTRKRLLGIPNVQPFAVQNLGKYERQAWQVAEFPANGKNHLEEQREREASYRKFILDLYHAKPISGPSWLHGAKAGRMVHVAAVDAPVTQADVKAIARDAWKAIGSAKDSPTKAGVDILGWEFALEVNELAKQVAAESRVDVSFKKIPREVLDKKAVEQGDVKFFELGALSVDVKQKAREVTLKLTDFVIPTDDIPEEARKAIKHWSQLVDYWAVDWDYKNDTFHNQWQAYRTRKDPKIELETKYEYKEPGKYQIVVKVIDILGNDTTKTLEVTVK
jgi:adenine-specific DNA-methyltransferase